MRHFGKEVCVESAVNLSESCKRALHIFALHQVEQMHASHAIPQQLTEMIPRVHVSGAYDMCSICQGGALWLNAPDG